MLVVIPAIAGLPGLADSGTVAQSTSDAAEEEGMFFGNGKAEPKVGNRGSIARQLPGNGSVGLQQMPRCFKYWSCSSGVAFAVVDADHSAFHRMMRRCTGSQGVHLQRLNR
jgi:hypothetical protein